MREPRMIVSTEGMEASGKTRFSIKDVPRPLRFLDFDYGLEGVDGAPDVLGADPGFIYSRYDLSGIGGVGMNEGQVRTQAQTVVRQFIADYMAALGNVRTIVVDTLTAAWAGQRIARSEDKYAEMEEEFRSMVRAAYKQTATNVIFIHHLRQDWARTQDGKAYKGKTWSRDGMDNMLNMVQLGIRHRYVPPTMAGGLQVTEGKFEIDILKSRDAIGFVGKTLPGMTFPDLCSMVCPSIDWSK